MNNNRPPIHFPQPIFTLVEARAWFPALKPLSVAIQVHRWENVGYLRRVKRGIYLSAAYQPEEFALAAVLREPSYISLESALNAYGMLPDVAQEVTSITTSPARRYTTEIGTYSYHKVMPAVFFGFSGSWTPAGLPYRIATPEKALLDYLSIRCYATYQDVQIDQFLEGMRLRRPVSFEFGRYRSYLKAYPPRLRMWLSGVADVFATNNYKV